MPFTSSSLLSRKLYVAFWYSIASTQKAKTKDDNATKKYVEDLIHRIQKGKHSVSTIKNQKQDATLHTEATMFNHV